MLADYFFVVQKEVNVWLYIDLSLFDKVECGRHHSKVPNEKPPELVGEICTELLRDEV